QGQVVVRAGRHVDRDVAPSAQGRALEAQDAQRLSLPLAVYHFEGCIAAQARSGRKVPLYPDYTEDAVTHTRGVSPARMAPSAARTEQRGVWGRHGSDGRR